LAHKKFELKGKNPKQLKEKLEIKEPRKIGKTITKSSTLLRQSEQDEPSMVHFNVLKNQQTEIERRSVKHELPSKN